MKKIIDLSPNFSKKKRSPRTIKYVIMHYTGMQSEIESLKRLKNPSSAVSSHYLINKRGKIYQLVKDEHVAWHAGKSKWGKTKNLNKNSIGIELVNKGHKYGYENFPKSQIDSLIILCKKLKRNYKIKKKNFLGHSDIAPLRKMDPGEKFPWKKLSKEKIGVWYKTDKQILKILDKNKKKTQFFINIHKMGYRYFNKKRRLRSDKKIIFAFQRRYLPLNVTGKIDEKTLQISSFLINSKK